MGRLPDSPGLHNAMMNYMDRHGKRGVVTRLEGHVSRLKNGMYRITGRRYVVNLKPQKVREMVQKVHPTTSPRHGFKFSNIPTRKGVSVGFPTIIHDRESCAAILDSVYEMAEQVATANNMSVDAAIDDVLKSEGWTLLPTHRVMIRNQIADDRIERLFKETLWSLAMPIPARSGDSQPNAAYVTLLSAARNFLWDGRGDCPESKNGAICFALDMAVKRQRKLCKLKERRGELKAIICSRLDRAGFYQTWVWKEHKVQSNRVDWQAGRLAWINDMILEFGGQP